MGERRRWVWVVGALAAVLVVAGIGVALANGQPGPAASTPSATPMPSVSALRTPTPGPTPTADGYPANTTGYDVTTLPQVNVFAVIPALPVDDDPFAAPTGETAVARGIGAPVWADPAGQPVAYVPHDFPYGGTVLPVVEKQAHWVKVLLTGRQAVPSQGDSAQVAGWLRMSDVDLSPVSESVVVSIANRTIDIVRADGTQERVATDFAWGTERTPTPVGRTFVMTTRTVPEYAYTRGYPIVYWAVQSPTLDGFDGADVAPAAFHYHDDRSGPVSNGCIRVDPDAIARLATLAPGTPVMISP